MENVDQVDELSDAAAKTAGAEESTYDADDLHLSATEVSALATKLANNSVTYQDALGLSAAEMDAMEFRAGELLRQGKVKQALRVFVALTKLNRFEGRYFRGAGVAFHHMRQYGMAYGACDLALATNNADKISESLRAECLIFVIDKAAAIEAYDELFKKGAGTALEVPYLQRAASVRQLLR